MDRRTILSRDDHFDLDLTRRRAASLQAIRQKLSERGFDEAGLLEALGLDELFHASTAWAPLWDRYVLSPDDPSHLLIRAFFLSLPVDRAALERTLAPAEVELLVEVGLLAPLEDGRLRSPVMIYPFDGLHIATDWAFEADSTVEGLKNRVMYLGSDSCVTARWAASHRGERCLDLCTGSGVIALSCAARFDEVVAVDINPRAVNFASFNALFNGLDNCRFLQGDLFEPLGGDRFDLVVANPPFVPSPELGTVLFRDGGRGGEEVLSRIVEGCPTRLEPEGTALLRTDLAHHSDRRYDEKIATWLGGGGAGFDAIALETEAVDPIHYAAQHHSHLMRDPSWEREVCRWIDGYRAEGIESISPGHIALRRKAGGALRWMSLDVPLSFGHDSDFSDFTRQLFRRLDQLGRLDMVSTRFFLDCTSGELELLLPEEPASGVSLDAPLANAMIEKSDQGFSAAEVVESLRMRGFELDDEDDEAALALAETFGQLFVMGYLHLKETELPEPEPEC